MTYGCGFGTQSTYICGIQHQCSTSFIPRSGTSISNGTQGKSVDSGGDDNDDADEMQSLSFMALRLRVRTMVMFLAVMETCF